MIRLAIFFLLLISSVVVSNAEEYAVLYLEGQAKVKGVAVKLLQILSDQNVLEISEGSEIVLANNLGQYIILNKQQKIDLRYVDKDLIGAGVNDFGLIELIKKGTAEDRDDLYVSGAVIRPVYRVALNPYSRQITLGATDSIGVNIYVSDKDYVPSEQKFEFRDLFDKLILKGSFFTHSDDESLVHIKRHSSDNDPFEITLIMSVKEIHSKLTANNSNESSVCILKLGQGHISKVFNTQKAIRVISKIDAEILRSKLALLKSGSWVSKLLMAYYLESKELYASALYYQQLCSNHFTDKRYLFETMNFRVFNHR